jgi:hypothetical protein
MTQQPSGLGESPVAAPPPVGGEQKKDEKKKKKGNRGIETMYRVTYQNHISLSQLADNKANMLLSINGVIISIMIAIVTRTGGAVSWSLAPMIVLITGCMVSLGFAVLAARPRFSRNAVTIDQVRNDAGNLLFFGQFTTMPLAEFQESLRVLTKDRNLLYAHLGRQLYHMGEILSSKYRYLRLAYGVFLVSTALATILFVLMYATGRFAPVA